MQANTAGANSPYDSSTAAELEQVVESFVSAVDAPDSVAKEFSEMMKGMLSRVEESERDAAIAKERAREAEERAEQAEERVEELEQELNDEKNRRSAEIEGCHNRISGVKDDLQGLNPTPQADKTTMQQGDLTPIEQLSQADDIEEVTDSQSVRRAVSLFKNLDSWGSRTPKGIVLKPNDNPLRLLEADQDESLAWKQYYRAAETLEQLSHGSVTFFDSDKHGKMLCLHERSETFERVVNGSLTASSVEAEG